MQHDEMQSWWGFWIWIVIKFRIRTSSTSNIVRKNEQRPLSMCWIWKLSKLCSHKSINKNCKNNPIKSYDCFEASYVSCIKYIKLTKHFKHINYIWITFSGQLDQLGKVGRLLCSLRTRKSKQVHFKIMSQLQFTHETYIFNE